MNRRVSNISLRGVGVDFARPLAEGKQPEQAEFVIEADECIVQAGSTKLVIRMAADKKAIEVVYVPNRSTGQKTVTVESSVAGTTIKVGT